MNRAQRIAFRRITGGPVPKDPGAAFAALDALRRGGGLTAEQVVETARAEDSPLHGSFEWDDGVAAEQYRLIQARNLIRAVVAVSPGQRLEDAPRVFHHVPSPDGDGPGFYELGEVIAQHVDMAQAALREALTDLRAAQSRVADLRHHFATGEREDAMAIIAIAAQALSTAEAALTRLH